MATNQRSNTAAPRGISRKGTGDDGGSAQNVSTENYEKILETLNTKIDSRFEKFDVDTKTREVRSLELVGIFIGIVSFVSLTTQILSRISDVATAAFFVILLFCMQFALVVLFDMLIAKQTTEIDGITRPLPLFKDWRLWLILIVFGIGALSILGFWNRGLNPVAGTVEFEDAVEKKVENLCNNVVEQTTYSKQEVNDMVNSIKADLYELNKGQGN